MFVKYTNEFGKGQTLRAVEAQAKDEKTKERISALVPIIAIAVILLFTLIAESITAHAEEATTYTYITTFGRQPMQSDIINNNWYYYTDTLTVSEPMAGYGMLGGKCGWLVLQSNGSVGHYTYSVGGKVFTDSSGRKWTASSGTTINPFTYTHESVETNIPLFSTREEAESYLLTGDTTGQLNAPKYDVDFTDSNSYDASYSLQGFTCDNAIVASWTGATTPTFVPRENGEVTVNEYVKIYVNYGSGSKEHKVVPLSNLSYTIQFDNISSNEEPLVAMEFVPIYSTGTGLFGQYFYGNTIAVNFDTKGNILSIDELATNTSTGADSAINEFLQDMGNKGTLGYLQNVVYKEENHVLSARTATISWSTTKDIPNARVQIVSENMYGTWTEQFTGMHVYKDYLDDIMYSNGSLTFVSQEPVRTWCEEKGYNITNPLKYRTYLTNYYYVRLVVYDDATDTYDYGGWVRIDINQGNSTQLPWTNTGTGDWNQTTGEWEQDNESEDSYNYETGSDGTITEPINIANLDDINLNAFTWMWYNIKAMVNTMGDFPSLVTTVFGFLPQQFIVALGAMLIAVVLMRFLGR